MERRQTPRIQISMEVTYETGDDFVSSYLFDISGGGVFIRTDEPLRAETPLRVCFHVPGITDSLVAQGTVAWSRDGEGGQEPGMGVRFDQMGFEDRQRLEAFLKG